MKQLITLALLLTTLSASAKKIKLHIDATAPSWMKQAFVIVNADADNAIPLDLASGKASLDIKVEQGSFIQIGQDRRLDAQTRNVFIADSKRISINLEDGTTDGSDLNQRFHDLLTKSWNILRAEIHIDLPPPADRSDKALREQGQQRAAMYDHFQQQKREDYLKLLTQIDRDNKDNIIPAWFFRVNPYDNFIGLDSTVKNIPVWMKHPIMKK